MSARFKGRREDARLLTGQGRYTADWNLPDQLYGVFLRSDHAHAEIAALNVEAARRAPGVVAVFTGADTGKAGFKSPPSLVKYPGKGGMAIKIPHREVLAERRGRFRGHENAPVVATRAAPAHPPPPETEGRRRCPPGVARGAAAAAGAA